MCKKSVIHIYRYNWLFPGFFFKERERERERERDERDERDRQRERERERERERDRQTERERQRERETKREYVTCQGGHVENHSAIAPVISPEILQA